MAHDTRILSMSNADCNILMTLQSCRYQLLSVVIRALVYAFEVYLVCVEHIFDDIVVDLADEG